MWREKARGYKDGFGPVSTPAARLLLSVLAAAAVSPAYARGPSLGVELSAATGAYLPVGTNLPGSVGFSLEAVVPVTPQLAVGLLAATSSHDAGASIDQYGLDSATLVGEWRLDIGRLVPVIRAGAGVLHLGAPDGTSRFFPAYEVGLAVDWWTDAPHRGFAVGGEVRYLGLLDGQAPFPVIAAYSVRVSWAF